MKKRELNYLVIVPFVVVSIVFTFFGQAIQNEQFSVFAQNVNHSAQNSEDDQLSTGNGEIQLHKFSIWDLFVNTTMAYINPNGLSDKSIVYIYEFKDSEDAKETLLHISKRYDALVESWYVGQVKPYPNDSEISIWEPVRLDSSIAQDYVKQNDVQLIASNLPIPGENRTDAYWVQNDEWLEHINR